MPRLNTGAFSVDKPGYPPRSSPTESITSFTTASTSGKKRSIAAVSEGWASFQRAGFVPLPLGTKPRMSPPTFEPSQQKKADQECTLLAGQWVAATGQDFNILEDSLSSCAFCILVTAKNPGLIVFFTTFAEWSGTWLTMLTKSIWPTWIAMRQSTCILS